MSDNHIMAQGEAEVRALPSLVLMQVHLAESAESEDGALSRLKRRMEAAKQLLQEMDAVEIHFGPMLLGDLDEEDALGHAHLAKKAAAMARARSFGRTGASPSSADASETIRVRATAKWRFQGETDEERIKFFSDLRRRLADIADASSKPPETPPMWPTPEEEMQAMMANIGREAAPPDHRIPRYYFATELTTEQEELAYEQAIANAKATAERVVRSSGKHVDALIRVMEHSAVEHNQELHMKQHLSGETWPQLAGPTRSQVWDDMREVRFSFKVSATFELV